MTVRKRDIRRALAVLLAFIVCFCSAPIWGGTMVLSAAESEPGETVSDDVAVSTGGSEDAPPILRDGTEIKIDEDHFGVNNAFVKFIKRYDKDYEGDEGYGYLSDEERTAVKSMEIPDEYDDQNITEVKGLKYFGSLESLTVKASKLEELDIGGNTALTSLDLYGCEYLASLDLKKNTNLKNLSMTSCEEITSLDLSLNTALQSVDISYSKNLTGINLSNAGNLNSLICSDNPKLSGIELGANKEDLKSFTCTGSSVKTLDLSGAVNIENFTCYSNSQLEAIKGLNNLQALTELILYENGLKTLDFTGNTVIENIDIHNNSSLQEVKLGGNTSLVNIELNDNKLKNLDLSGLAKLKSLNCNNNELLSVTLSGNTSLTSADIGNNNLSSIDISSITTLEELYCGSNSLTELKGIGYLKKLKTLSCKNNLLKSLNLTGLKSLKKLDCSDNKITELTVPDYKNLSEINIGGNKLLSIESGDKSPFREISNTMSKRTVTTSKTDKGYLVVLGSGMASKEHYELRGCPEGIEWEITDKGILFKSDPFGDKTKLTVYLDYFVSADDHTSNDGYDYNYDTDRYDHYYGNLVIPIEIWSIDISEDDINKKVRLDEANFPDPEFRQAISEGCAYAIYDDYGYEDNIYCNEGEEFQPGKVTSLYLEGRNIKDLTGLKYFVQLETLEVNDNKLTSLDLSGCKVLKRLSCTDNSLTKLDLTGLSRLEELSCQKNKLTSLDLSGCKVLNHLNCADNSLTKLDLTGLSSLEELSFQGNKLSSIVLSGCQTLKTLDCSDHSLTKLDLTGLSSLEELFCQKNKLSSLDLSDCQALKTIDCSENSLTKLDITGLSSLEELSCQKNKLSSLILSGCQALKTLYCYDNCLTKLDLTGLSNLEGLYCQRNMLSSLDLSPLSSLTNLNCSDNGLFDLDLSKNSKLEYIYTSDDYYGYYYYGGTLEQRATVKVVKNGEYWVAMDPRLPKNPKDSAIKYMDSDPGIYGAEAVDGGWRWKKEIFGDKYIKTLIIEREISYVGHYEESEESEESSSLILRLKISFINQESMDKASVELNEENFPDKAFRDYLSESYPDNITDGKINTLEIDKVSMDIYPDEYIGEDGKRIVDYSKTLGSLKGIEKLIALQDLRLSGARNLKKIDLSKNTLLTSVYISNCGIEWLDLTHQGSLTSLYVYDTPVLGIDLNKDCYINDLNISPSTGVMTAVKTDDGKWTLDMPENWGKNSETKVFNLSEGLSDGKVIWDEEKLVPLTMTYSYMLKKDYEPGEQYDGNDYFTVTVRITNNEQPLPERDIIELTEENFPDPAFRDYLNENYGRGKGIIDTAELEELQIYNYSDSEYDPLNKLTDMRGIEKLNRLRTLYLYNLPIKSLDLSKNKALTSITIESCNLSELKIGDKESSCEWLESCYVGQAALSKLETGYCPRLRSLELPGSSISSIDLKKNTSLRRLNLKDNKLKSLDVSNCSKLVYLDVSNTQESAEGMNRIKSISLTGLRDLETLLLNGNNLSSIKLDGLDKLSEFSIDGGEEGKLKEVDLNNLTSLTSLSITKRLSYTNDYYWYSDGYSYYSWYDESEKEEGKSEETLTVKGDFRTFKNLRTLRLENVTVSGNSGIGLDLSKCGKLYSLSLAASKVENLSLKGNTTLRYLYLNDIGDLRDLDVSGCLQLDSLDISNIGIESLNVDEMNSLKFLDCSHNRLKTLDLSGVPGLQILRCGYNKLKDLDLQNNSALKYLDCNHNPMRSIITLDGGSSSGEGTEEEGTEEEGEEGEEEEEEYVPEVSSELKELVIDGCAFTSLDLTDMLAPDYETLSYESEILEFTWDDEEILEFVLPTASTSAVSLMSEEEAEAKKNDTSCRRILKLGSPNNKFDKSKVSNENLGDGTLTDEGIVYEAGQTIPEVITYDYRVDNSLGRELRPMSVKIMGCVKLSDRSREEEYTDDPYDPYDPYNPYDPYDPYESYDPYKNDPDNPYSKYSLSANRSEMPISNIFSALHDTDASDVTGINSKNAKFQWFGYGDFIGRQKTVISGGKYQISEFFTKFDGYFGNAKHKYVVSNKKVAKVDAKGMLTAKKRGQITVSMKQKIGSGSWQDIGEPVEFYVQMPKMEKKRKVSLDPNLKLNAVEFLSCTAYAPSRWECKSKVASVSENGDILIAGAGKAKITAWYESSGKKRGKFTTTLKIK